MTIERRLVVGLGDITTVVYECCKCKARVSIHPDDLGVLAGKCPRCSYTWNLAQQPEGNNQGVVGFEKSYFTNFAEALGKIRRMEPQTIGFRLLPEFKEPE